MTDDINSKGNSVFPISNNFSFSSMSADDADDRRKLSYSNREIAKASGWGAGTEHDHRHDRRHDHRARTRPRKDCDVGA